jgi:hypothetical protein
MVGGHYWIRVASASLAGVLCAFPALAGGTIISEVKLGGLFHGLLNNPQQENGGDVNAEILFSPPGWFVTETHKRWLEMLLDPRPIIGASVNTSGGTSQFYAGFNWQIPLYTALATPDDSFDVAFSFGGAVHDGKTSVTDDKRNALGTRVLFHLSGELIYAFDERYNISGYFEHISNGGLARYNRSLNSAGVRLGYRF